MSTTIDRRYSVAEGTAIKAPVRVATTANITLGGLLTIDGVTVVEHDRVLVKNQTNAVLNGIYEASTGNWRRTKDFDGARDVVRGTRVFPASGTVNAFREYMVSTNDPIIIGTSNITFVAVEPTTVISGAADYLSPEMFGTIGLSAALDTAAWAALAAAAVRGSRIVARGQYGIVKAGGGLGSGVAAITFTGLASLNVDLTGAVFNVQSAFTQAFKFENCDRVKVAGGDFYGFAHTEILAGHSPSEFVHSQGGFYIGTSYLYFLGCQGVHVRGVKGIHGVGHDIFCWQSQDIDIQECDLGGIGPAYIAAIENSSDFGIVVYPAEYPTTGPNVRANLSNNHIYDHAFGFQAVACKTLTVHGGTIGPCPGQHGGYGIELDAVSIKGVHFIDCYQFAFKNQLENYAGTINAGIQWVTTAWDVAQVVHVGDLRVAFGTAYECLVNHTSGSSFATDRDAGKWKVSPLMYRRGGVISGNTVQGCGQGFGVLNGGGLISLLDAYVTGLIVTDNTIMDGIADGVGNGDGLRLDRVRNATVTNNTIINMGRYGINCTESGGNFSGNTIYGTPDSAFNLAPAYNVQLRGNSIENCAQAAGAGPPIIVGNWSPATAQPSAYAGIFVAVEGNTITYMNNADPGGDTDSAYLMFFDTKHRVSLMNNRTNSAKIVRVDGGLLGKWGNNFAGFFSGAQQTVYTITHSTDRALDSGSTTAGELGNVLGTFIDEVAAYGGLQ